MENIKFKPEAPGKKLFVVPISPHQFSHGRVLYQTRASGVKANGERVKVLCTLPYGSLFNNGSYCACTEKQEPL
jgi:hypothetical protein